MRFVESASVSHVPEDEVLNCVNSTTSTFSLPLKDSTLPIIIFAVHITQVRTKYPQKFIDIYLQPYSVFQFAQMHSISTYLGSSWSTLHQNSKAQLLLILLPLCYIVLIPYQGDIRQENASKYACLVQFRRYKECSKSMAAFMVTQYQGGPS